MLRNASNRLIWRRLTSKRLADSNVLRSSLNITGYVWDYAAESSPSAVPVKAAPASLLHWPKASPGAVPLHAGLTPQYLSILWGSEVIALPALPEPPLPVTQPDLAPARQLERLAALLFATGGYERVVFFERQLAWTCAAFSAHADRAAYVHQTFSITPLPWERIPGLPRPILPGKNLADAFTSDEFLQPFRAQVFPPQPALFTSAQADIAARTLAQRTLTAWRAAARAQAQKRLHHLNTLEQAVRSAALVRLSGAMQEAAIWLTRYSHLAAAPDTLEKMLSSAHSVLRSPKMPPVPIALDKPVVQDLLQHMRQLKTPAQAVKNAYDKLVKAAAGAGRFVDPWVLLNSIVGPALAEYAAAVHPHALQHPILFRTPATVLLEAIDTDLVSFTKPLQQLLHRLYQSAQHMHSLFDRAALATESITLQEEGWLDDIDIEKHLAKKIIDDDLLWRYPLLIQAALTQMDSEQPAGEYRRLASGVLQALQPVRQQQARSNAALAIVETVGIVAADVLLTALAPPLGAAFSLAVSSKGVYDAISEYDDAAAPYFCSFDPAQALSEQSPDSSAIALSVAFAALDIAPVLRGVKKVVQ